MRATGFSRATVPENRMAMLPGSVKIGDKRPLGAHPGGDTPPPNLMPGKDRQTKRAPCFHGALLQTSGTPKAARIAAALDARVWFGAPNVLTPPLTIALRGAIRVF